MAVNATLGSRITDIIESEYATIPSLSYKDIINASINQVADMMSDELLMKYSPSPTGVTSASGASIEDKKILQVTRVDANSSGIERKCRELSRVEFASARDSNSIHYATVFSPVYRVDSMNAASTIVIYPDCNDSGQEGNIWYWPYVLASTDSTGITTATLNTTLFLPSQAMHAIVLKCCSNLLHAYVSDMIQDEEDSEMASLLVAQVTGLNQQFIVEMTRFIDKPSVPGSEEKIKGQGE